MDTDVEILGAIGMGRLILDELSPTVCNYCNMIMLDLGMINLATQDKLKKAV